MPILSKVEINSAIATPFIPAMNARIMPSIRLLTNEMMVDFKTYCVFLEIAIPGKNVFNPPIKTFSTKMGAINCTSEEAKNFGPRNNVRVGLQMIVEINIRYKNM